MWQWNLQKFIDRVNITKRSEEVKLLSQGNLILNCRKGEKKGFSAFIKKTLFYGQCFED